MSSHKANQEMLSRYHAFLKSKIDKKYHRLIDRLGSIRFYALTTQDNGLEKYYAPATHQEIKNYESIGRYESYVIILDMTYEFLQIEKEPIKQCFTVVNQQKNKYKDLNVGSLIAQFL